MKKIISFLVIISMLVSVLFITTPSNVRADTIDMRGGFELVPSDSDSTGVKVDSTYTLKSNTPITLAEITSRLSIDKEPAPTITESAPGMFAINLSREFEQNKLYTFRIKCPGNDDITWTFQTIKTFGIESVLPADESTGVPVNSGIEINLTHDNYENLDNYFEITPKVEGRFERHKKTYVFVPKGFKNGTLYTVTVKEGVKLNDTNYKLEDNYSFSFETALSGTQTIEDTYTGYFSYNKNLNEFSPSENPKIPLYYYVNNESSDTASIEVSNCVYSYPGIDAFIDAVDKRNQVPIWAYYSFSENIADKTGLPKVVEFNQKLPVNSSDINFINIPQKLHEGYYLLDSTYENINFQTFIEVTEIGMYIVKSEGKTLIWLNDLSAKTSINGATITDVGSNLTFITDNSGVAYFDTPKSNPSDKESTLLQDSKTYFKIATKDNKTAVLNYYSYAYNYYWGEDPNLYWNYLFTDRGIYKPDDTIKLWGMVKNRYSEQTVDTVTVEVSRGFSYWGYERAMDSYYSNYTDQPIASESFTVENGIYKGNVDLPSPDQGGYRVVVKAGETVISSAYITVENYTKPTYKLEITSDKEAIFANQAFNFEIKASFFEGTALPKLPIKYSIENNYMLKDMSGTKNTNANGIVKIKYTPELFSDSQGEVYANLNVSSSLPQIGQISENKNVRVFANDISASFETEISGTERKISATVNKIVLERLNNGTSADYSDYLGDPIVSRVLSGTIYKNSWVRSENGTYYDFISKKTETMYKYDLVTVKLKDFEMTTNNEGKADYSFNSAINNDVYYSAKINCLDNSGKRMNFEVYISDSHIYSSDYHNENYNYKLTGGKESYKINDNVDLTFKKGTTLMPSGSYLFVKSQNGLRDYTVEDNPRFQFSFKETNMPNVFVTGIFFNGLTYIESEIYNCVFDSKTKELTLNAKTDKTSYRPGDTVTIDVSAKDKSLSPRSAIVNLSMVDEALFKLQEQYVDTLAALYKSVPSGIDFSYSSHLNSGFQGYSTGGMSYGPFPGYSVTRDSVKDISSIPESADSVREDFKDTAFFDTIILDNEGNGQFSFKLPDNITSWRITLNGVTQDLLGGSNTVSLRVSLPFFIDYSLNTDYLTGDEPVLGVNAYGTGLTDNQIVKFSVSSASGKTITKTGKAFDRINIPLWELKAGTESITIRASTTTGLNDAVKHNITVSDTYHEFDNAAYKKLSDGIKFASGTKGTAKIIFIDRSRGQFLPSITSLKYTYGDRIDQRLASSIAQNLLEKYFPKYSGNKFAAEPDISEYQKSDGGIAILPYASSDADLTAKLIPFIEDDVNLVSLKNYLYSILEKDSSSKRGNALYGLAVLSEPVLLDIDRIAAIDNLSVKETIYLALAYCELGETSKAKKLYEEKILKHIGKISPYYRVSVGVDNDDVLECTSLASILASKLNKPERTGLYNYCLKNSTNDTLINIEKLLYISSEIEKYDAVSASFSYTLSGKKHDVDLSNGNMFVLKVPSKNLNKVIISNVKGSASAIAIKKAPEYTAKELDSNISVSRKYSVYKSDGTVTTTFKENDIVKVEISWKIGKKAMDGNYEITDYLPSGLKPIENEWQFGPNSFKCWYFRNIDGQKISFFAYKYKRSYQPKPFVYYARVISAGTFKADSTTIQGLGTTNIINIGNPATITIKSLT
ncbi:MAG: alpha-2-macroglobulin family protein [Clostridia bacterium]|jgi:hypothetical protein